jgi:hypothetical protein
MAPEASRQLLAGCNMISPTNRRGAMIFFAQANRRIAAPAGAASAGLLACPIASIVVYNFSVMIPSYQVSLERTKVFTSFFWLTLERYCLAFNIDHHTT